MVGTRPLLGGVHITMRYITACESLSIAFSFERLTLTNASPM